MPAEGNIIIRRAKVNNLKDITVEIPRNRLVVVTGISAALDRCAAALGQPLAVELLPLQNFYRAEEYHQDYLEKNPNGYCHLSPAIFRIAEEA